MCDIDMMQLLKFNVLIWRTLDELKTCNLLAELER